MCVNNAHYYDDIYSCHDMLSQTSCVHVLIVSGNISTCPAASQTTPVVHQPSARGATTTTACGKGYERLSGDTARSGVIDVGPGPDMVATVLESDPDNVIGWIVEPLEQTVICTNNPEKYFIVCSRISRSIGRGTCGSGLMMATEE